MKMNAMKGLLVTLGICFFGANAFAADDVAAKLAPTIEKAKAWAADKTIVEAVKKANSSPDAKYKDMTQDKWKDLKVIDALVKKLTKNPAAEAMKKLKTETVSEAFISAADGTKVGFLAKTSGWSHKGKAKHDDPMAGKVWIGKVETDESTGVQQIQFGVPIMDGGKVIGSLVVGVAVSKL
jgi:hypothetical protein